MLIRSFKKIRDVTQTKKKLPKRKLEKQEVSLKKEIWMISWYRSSKDRRKNDHLRTGFIYDHILAGKSNQWQARDLGWNVEVSFLRFSSILGTPECICVYHVKNTFLNQHFSNSIKLFMKLWHFFKFPH